MNQPKIPLAQISAASNGRAAVAVARLPLSGGRQALHVLKYAPASVGDWGRRGELAALVERAAAKQGFRRDRRCRGGWRYVGA